MTAAIALTMGDPSGVGLELALARVARGRRRAVLPHRRSRGGGARRPRARAGDAAGDDDARRGRASLRPRAADRAAERAGRGGTRQARPRQRAGDPGIDRARRRICPARRGAGGRHQPDRQEDALRRRLPPSRPHGIPRRARRRLGPPGDAGYADLVAAARSGPGDDPHPAARGPCGAHPRGHRDHGAHRRPRPQGALQDRTAADRRRRTEPARRRRRRHRRRGAPDHRPRHRASCGARGSTSSGRCRPTRCSTPARANATTSR